jgi:hypothetical protein
MLPIKTAPSKNKKRNTYSNLKRYFTNIINRIGSRELELHQLFILWTLDRKEAK